MTGLSRAELAAPCPRAAALPPTRLFRFLPGPPRLPTACTQLPMSHEKPARSLAARRVHLDPTRVLVQHSRDSQFSKDPGPVTCDTEPVLTSRASGTYGSELALRNCTSVARSTDIVQKRSSERKGARRPGWISDLDHVTSSATRVHTR